MHYAPPPSSDIPATLPPFRDVKPIPNSLLDHSTICFEEGLYSQGFALQSRCLESGVETQTPARVPPPPHLTFASTLTVHPSFTTRTVKAERHVASNDALKYLRQAVNTLGARDAEMKTAFRFEQREGLSERSRRANTRRSDANSAEDEEVDKPGFIRSDYYQKQSLWSHAEDFWAIVGWAFNCSVLHKARWERWKAWLEQMLDLLHNDLERHVQLHKDEGVDVGESLLAQYISVVGEGRNNRRRIMRAITADGTKKMAAEFGEVWKDETKPPTKKKEVDYSSKRRKLDLDNNQFGDYGDPDSEDEVSSDGKKRKSGSLDEGSSRRGKRASKSDDVDEDDIGSTSTLTFGDMDSIRLRQRLLTLLTRFSEVAPDKFMDIDELFSLFTEFLRPLPLAIFQHFAMPLTPFLSPKYSATLTEMLFRPLLGTNNGNGWVDQNAFENDFAPHAAITTLAVDNAKVSLLVESLLRALWNANILSGDGVSLRESVERGIAAREDKVAFDGRKKTGRNGFLDEQARTTLRCSAERMRVLLDLMAVS
ncbi:hypothetical protein M409DRAFT_65050 [Zasmidium cellare ATCC 36951]|uniref:Uncharacterized protein n=1 Tax=Zasmidium cellare ATCC 36951 TaxID=1080233 RepID=A0A6A6CQJ9_ZASCE|nr:uncharacterized protein M409DRAFT_65050 [Zasmidium cellare ATCC 36951]KAF2169365.1 hypothetical protein M409DRAFT_65050 [Zasmidium cellare ATCC 36951]